MEFSPLVVRYIKDQKNPENCDTIEIKPLDMKFGRSSEEKLFFMKYTMDVQTSTKDNTDIQTASKDKRKVSSSIMTADTLRAYLDAHLELLYRDDAPFEGIQFDLPGIRSVLVSTKTLSKAHSLGEKVLSSVRHSIEHYLHTILVADYDSWPRIKETASKKPTKSYFF